MSNTSKSYQVIEKKGRELRSGDIIHSRLGWIKLNNPDKELEQGFYDESFAVILPPISKLAESAETAREFLKDYIKKHPLNIYMDEEGDRFEFHVKLLSEYSYLNKEAHTEEKGEKESK